MFKKYSEIFRSVREDSAKRKLVRRSQREDSAKRKLVRRSLATGAGFHVRERRFRKAPVCAPLSVRERRFRKAPVCAPLSVRERRFRKAPVCAPLPVRERRNAESPVSAPLPENIAWDLQGGGNGTPADEGRRRDKLSAWGRHAGLKTAFFPLEGFSPRNPLPNRGNVVII